MFQKSPKKQPSFERLKSTLAQMALFSNQYALKVQRLEKFLAEKAAAKNARMAKLLQFLQGHPNPAFCKKSAQGRPRKMFQKSPKKEPKFERRKSTLAQMALSFNQYAFKLQRLKNILAQTAAPKAPEWPSYSNFSKLTQKPHFLKKCKRGTKGNFSKIAQKDALPEKAQKHTGANGIIL